MRIVPDLVRTSRVSVPVWIGGLLGWSVGRVVHAVSQVTPDATHYRVTLALNRLSGLDRVGTGWWIVLGALGCLAVWVIASLVVRRQGNPIGWGASVVLALPAAVAASLFLAADLSTRTGRFLVVGAAGLAGAGQLTVGALVSLRGFWTGSRWRPGPRFVWGASILVAVATGIWMALVQEPTGDEPAYLLAMHSLVHDHDLDVANNHAQQDYRFFYPADIQHGQLLPTVRGTTLPKHSLGLPILGAVAYAADGRMAVSGLCALVVAGLAATTYHLVRRRHGAAIALQCWSVVLLSAPPALYAGQIYPNAATALLVVVGLLCVPGHPTAAGTMFGLIPWFHLGTWPLAMGAVIVAVIRDRANTVRYLAPLLVFWGGLLGMHWYFWHALVPPAGVYGHFTLAQVPSALLGLFLDQESGVLWIAPIWVLCFAGAMAPRAASTRAEALLLVGWLVYVSTFSWWFGGWSPTGRFLLPAVGPMVLVLANGVHAVPTLARRLWTASAVATTALVAFPFFRFNAHDGTNTILDAAGRLGRIVAFGLPSVVVPRVSVWAVWCCGIFVVLVLLWRRVRSA